MHEYSTLSKINKILKKNGKELLSRNWKINRRKSEDFRLEGYFNLIMVGFFLTKGQGTLTPKRHNFQNKNHLGEHIWWKEYSQINLHTI